MRGGRWIVATIAVCLGFGAAARGQFTAPQQSVVRERLVGQLLSASGAPTPEAGDQLAVFAGDELIGVFTFTSTSGTSVDIVINGDNPDTAADEGATSGQSLTAKFYDSSTGTTLTNVRAQNTSGENISFKFMGELVLDVPGVPIDLTPSREVNFLLGVGSGDSGGGGGAGTGGDVNGDGKIDKKDAVLVLRVAMGAGFGLSAEITDAADVNGDGVVDVNDAIAVIQMSKAKK